MPAKSATLPIGTRVELHPATSAWMQGDKFGTVERVARTGRLYIRMDRSGKLRRFDNLDDLLRSWQEA